MLLLLIALGCRTKDEVVDSAVFIDEDNDGFDVLDDCDDTLASVNPDAAEGCNGLDDDCDGEVDEGVLLTVYTDDDGDGFGSGSLQACEITSGTADEGGDCDDTDDAVHPGADEICNGVDDDCDGDTDEDALDALTWYADSDTDGFGDPTTSDTGCLAPSGFVEDATDCDDTSAAVNPDALEVCNGLDDDCDSTLDEPAELLGSDAACPAVDCSDALAQLTAPATGALWIDGGTGVASQTWCDMDNHGGGWTLVMRCVEDNLAYSDAAWTDTSVLSETEFDLTVAGCSKYDAFNVVGFTELRSSSTDDFTDDFVEDLGSAQTSAQALFSSTGWEISTDFQSYFNEMMDPFGQEWGCTTYRSYGINQQDYLGVAFISGGGYCDWNGSARWGQRVNADHDGTGNHAGQGWGAYSTIGYEWSYAITQLMWVR